MPESVRSACASLIVLHGDGRPAELVRDLAHSYQSSTRRIGLFTSERVAGGAELEGFMNAVGADDQVDVVHLVLPDRDMGPEPAEDLTLELGEAIVDQLTATERTLRLRFPALHGVDSWVIVDLGRFWSESARKVTQSVLDIGAENRIRGVFAVAGSTAGSVAGTPDDRAGMVADATWILATSDFGDSSGLAGERASAWLIGTRSFTVNGRIWNLQSAAAGVHEALVEGPLRPVAESMLDESNEAARRWLEGRGIGSEQERDALTSSAAGDALERLAIDRSAVARMVPKHWGPAAELQFRRISGEPLRRFRKLVRGNASALYHGRPGEPGSGHRRSYDDALLTEVGRPGGAARAERFTTTASEGLDGLQRDVSSAGSSESLSNLDRARSDLDDATARLAEVKPWIARMLLAVTIVAILSKDATEIWVRAAWPALTALLLGIWLAMARRRAVRLRSVYVTAAEDRVRSKATEAVLAEQVEMMKSLREHVGAFLDEQGDPVPMGLGVPPPESARASDVLRLNEALRETLADFEDPGHLFSEEFAMRSCGQFFRAFPDGGDRRTTRADRLSPAAAAHRAAVRDDAEVALRSIGLDWDAERLMGVLLAVCHAEREHDAGVTGIADLGPGLATIALPRLAWSNAPRLESDLDAPQRVVAVIPDGQAPEGFEPVTATADVVADSSDPRRIALAWLLSQASARHDPPAPRPAGGPPRAEPEDGISPSNLAEGGGV